MTGKKSSPPAETDRGIPADRVYPILLTKLEGTLAVVIGGGGVGERKVRGLLTVGAAVRLISPSATWQLRAWAEADRLDWQQRPYDGAGDLIEAGLVFAATDRREVNAQVARQAAELGLLCNVADAPAEGDFFLPAVYRDEEVVIAVSSAGKSPTQARRLRDAIAEWLNQRRER